MSERGASRWYPAGRRRSRTAAGTAALAAVMLLGAAACGNGGGERDASDTGAAPNNSNASGQGSGAQPPAVAGGTVPRVLIAGTSLTAGLGLDPGDAYPALLQQKADSAGYAVRIENAGLSGETSAGLLRRMSWLLREPAAVVVVETGANDGLRGLDVDATRENLRAIGTEVRRTLPEARLLFVQMEAPPNLGEAYTQRFRAMYGEVARELGAELVPFLLEDVAGVEALNQADGIHPNEAGSRRVAETVWGTLAPVLQRLDPPQRIG